MKKGLIILILLLIFLFGCMEVPEEKPDVRVVCANAQDDGLCSGLNFVFGEGYEVDCCESFGKCCE